MNEPLGLYVMAVMYCIAGIMHFIKPKAYMRIMPNYLPKHKTLVYLSGLAEILLAIGLCLPTLKTISIYGIIAMLAVFLLVHFYMLSSKKASAGFPKWLLLFRLPLQFVLMYWAWTYIN
ncbi:MauE/DoxX family redox-associated membrane protein [Winogradskyella sp. 4-2091]|uniref:DoxX family protein n=1 Tax=Winogradskyella sp. 4-2091 TaxID=3381659 RepID=UPI003891EB1F